MGENNEVCSRCGQTKPIKLTLRDPEKEELLCQVCANRWALSDEEWGPPLPKLVRLWLEGKTDKRPPHFMLSNLTKQAKR